MKREYNFHSSMFLFCLSLFLGLTYFQPGFAQEGTTVSGTITSADDGLPIPGVNVTVQGTSTGTTTDFDGNYQIQVAADAVLVFSYVGFETQDIPVNNRSQIDVVLEVDAAELSEVVVIGYGTQKKKVSTASTSLVESKDLVQTASIDATSALQGQTSGVNITSTSGQPGAGMVVNIRGVGTAGNSAPLYVVDGVVVDGGIGYLDPSMIARVDILKDASAASIYGARAANGVVLVTTKKGEEGKINVNLNSYTGYQYTANRLDLLDSREYATIMNEARVNSGFAPLYPSEEIASLPNTNWQDELVNEGAIKQNHALTLSGGSERATFTTGLAYYGQEGLIGSQIDRSDYERITFNTNITYEVIEDVLEIGENFSFANITSSGVSDQGIYSNNIRGFLNAPPTMGVYNEDGSFARSNISSDITNPLGALYYNNNNLSKSNRAVGNIFAEADVNNFTFRTSFGIDFNDGSYRSFNPIYELSANAFNATSLVSQNSNKDISWIWENTIQYQTTLDDLHNIDVLLGTSARKAVYEYANASGTDLIFDTFERAYLSNTTNPEQNRVSGGRTDYSIQSYFARLLYDYDNKYLFTATIRRDGSSEFGPNNKYAYFPAFSAGWNIDSEEFFPTDSFINSFKLRASWGQNGNDQFNQQFAYLATISSYNKNYHFGTGDDEMPLAVGSSPDRVANADLVWETSEQWDIGFDARIFSDITLTFDYYNKTTRDWIVQPAVPLIAGALAPFTNGGDIRNEGLEFSANYNTTFGKDWTFSVNGNISHNNNEVLRIANANGIIYGEANLLFQGIDEINRVQEGFPIGYFYGLRTDGIFQNEAEVAAYSQGGNLIQPNAQPGDVRFVDLNGDGSINQDDKTMIGDPNPDINYGFNLDVTYKAFDFSVYTYGVAGNQNVFAVRSNERPFNNYTTSVFDRWTTEGSSNTVPRVTYGTTSNGNYTRFSDLYVQDAGFFRIKTVNLGVDLAQLSDDLDFFSTFRLYLTANNLFTFTDYEGMDPEIGFGNVNQSWARGIDVGYYPQPRTFLVGLNVNF
ncbi:SusC/RagA family TonB-linked outer membrane protein [Autumnicola musiva]|uniref:TonB-dependent receptor n=1 Tax=Autumnicola musiva TaxID=3075589 RepID=A0ABU3D2M1_9FLAO|nr:TonB-dependent receptor [Zunongwangia sp. F117]MDT0675258.1 TonB-dependent receptor [Zunongwangia sp. F117]